MKPLSSKKTLELLMQLDDDDSGDGTETFSESDFSAISNDDDSVSDDVQPSGCSSNTDVYSGKDGTKWTGANDGVGRNQAQNIFRVNPGVTAYCRNIKSPVDAWRTLIDEGCIRYIIACTNEYAQTFDPNWSLPESELESFIGLLYLRGLMNQRNFPLDLLWSKEFGNEAFTSTMSRDRFKSIKRFIRFDKRSMRRENIQNDKFCMISWVLNRFVENSMKT